MAFIPSHLTHCWDSTYQQKQEALLRLWRKCKETLQASEQQQATEIYKIMRTQKQTVSTKQTEGG